MIVKAIVFCDEMSCSLTHSSKYYLLTTVQNTITVMLKHVWHFSLAVIFCLCMHVCVGACTWVGENWLCPFWLMLWTTYLELSCQNMSEYIALIFTSDYSIWEVLIISKADQRGYTTAWGICCTQNDKWVSWMDMNTLTVCHVWNYHCHEDWHWCLTSQYLVGDCQHFVGMCCWCLFGVEVHVKWWRQCLPAKHWNIATKMHTVIPEDCNLHFPSILPDNTDGWDACTALV